MRNLIFITVIISFFAVACGQTGKQAQQTSKEPNKEKETAEMKDKVVKSDKEWRAALSTMEYHVLREKGTERAFTGDLLENKEKGVYVCGGCGLELFDSNTKFESGTGWPSFYDMVEKGNVKSIVDKSYGMVRTEVVCARCDGHLGHVFNDGPKPTGLRYCINSASLDFEKKD